MGMRRSLSMLAAAVLGLVAAQAEAGGGGQYGGGQMGRPGAGAPSEADTTPREEKPDAAAKKAYEAAMKALRKARELDVAAADAPNADKRTRALEKASENYYRALDLFTLALSNRGDLSDAWSNVGFIHLRIGAYREAVDDFDHALKQQPGVPDSIEYRAEALLHLHYLEDVQAAYMDLAAHARDRADRLMAFMQKWLSERRADPEGLRATQLDAFDQWLKERLKEASP